MSYFVLGIMPYITIAIFVLGMINRFYVWSRTPQPGAITLFPAPSPGAGTFWSVVRESLLFPGLFRGDKALWAFAWIFHVTLALIAVGHVRVFTDFPRLWAALGIDADRMSAVSGGAAGIVIAVFAVLLVLRRAAVVRVREVTNFSDILALLLVVSILVTGNWMRFGEHFDLSVTRTYFYQLSTFSVSASSLPAAGMFTVHFLLAQMLIIFIPFSKIMHFGGIFFTQTVIQKA